jgi:hypothetical protein
MPLKLQQDEQLQLNLTPMIDVLFLLIIFFMVATTFGDLERNMELQVPEVADAGDSVEPARPLVINVFADGTLDLDDAARRSAEPHRSADRGDSWRRRVRVSARGVGALRVPECEYLGAGNHGADRQRGRRAAALNRERRTCLDFY